jgi:hypothetical protein
MKNYNRIGSTLRCLAALIPHVFPAKDTLRTSFVWVANVVLVLALFGAFVSLANTPRYDQTFRLGGLRVHEKLNMFMTRFPHADCGAPLEDGAARRHPLEDPDRPGWVGCCIDDPRELSAFPVFKILPMNSSCYVGVDFYKERLHSIHFEADASTIDRVLPDFVKDYGPPSRDTIIWTSTVPVRFATWMNDDSTLELSEELLKGDDLKIRLPILKGASEAKIVLFDLYGLGWDQSDQ